MVKAAFKIVFGFILLVAAIQHWHRGLFVLVLGFLGAAAFLSGAADAFIWLGVRLGGPWKRSP
jgi:hypothetical protein